MTGAILLAAGESRRMGRTKALLPFAGRTLIQHIADALAESRAADIVVVTGHDAENVSRALDGAPVRCVFNAAFRDGMLSSVRAGLRALDPRCTAALLALGDQPSITAALVDRLIAQHEDHGARIVVPTTGGRRGHPMLFSTEFRDDVLTRFENTGLRGLLAAHPGDVTELDGAGHAILLDLDTPGDYARALGELLHNDPRP